MTAELPQSRKPLFSVLALSVFIAVVSSGEARVHNLTWEILYQYKYLNCYKKLAIAINGMTPGPVVSATEGDTIVVNNLLMENVAIHWHGIRQGHSMLVVEADGNYVEPFVTQPPPGPLWNDSESRKAQSASIKAEKDHIQTPPSASDKVILLLNTQNTFRGSTVWSLDNVSHSLPNTPYLIALKKNWSDVFDHTPAPESYDQNYDIYSVANNTNATSSSSIYRLTFNSMVLGYGHGKFNPSTDTQKFSLINPIRKNTVVLNPYGWNASRFQVDNPGIWIFHCHVEAHFLLGMMVLFESGSEMEAEPPQQIMGCGKTKRPMNP
ncbi:L-ascorbate oxidase [Melia azedarach]|uniref:L-ascorbate oxidase n=1 Tax=Melia azedarach TaxID=155640 RepID=A0ACC1XWE7_MELAZ|nr:L-ascorbate oxidase [Melia azedarach]